MPRRGSQGRLTGDNPEGDVYGPRTVFGFQVKLWGGVKMSRLCKTPEDLKARYPTSQEEWAQLGQLVKTSEVLRVKS